MRLIFLILMLTGALAGCGGDEMLAAPAPFPPTLPTVIDRGGGVVASPEVYPIVFAGYDPATVATVQDFVNTLGAAPYWAATTKEYGVGLLVGHPAIVVPTAPAANLTLVEVAQWMAERLDANDPLFPEAGPGTVFAIFYPDGVTISDSFGGGACTSWLGYHDHAARKDGTQVPFVVIPSCFPGATEEVLVDQTTILLSHELVEAVTDPESTSFQGVDPEHRAWGVDFGSEVADLCDEVVEPATVKEPSFPYVVSRSWSNAAAKGLHDPCVPAVGSVYFAAAPIVQDTVGLGQGVFIRSGETRTVEIDLLADGDPGGPWQVELIDAESFRGVTAPRLAFKLDRTTGTRGDKLHADITVLSGNKGDTEIFYVVSTLGNVENAWVGVVGN